MRYNFYCQQVHYWRIFWWDVRQIHERLHSMSKLRSRLFLIRTQLSTEDVDENVALVHAARSINEDATDAAKQQAPVDTLQSNAADTPTPPVAAQETTPPQCRIA